MTGIDILQLILIAIALVAAIVWGRHVLRKRKKRFEGRDEIALEEFVRRYYSDSVISTGLIDEVLNKVSQFYQLPKGVLRPSDSFDKELAPVENFQDPIIDINWYINALIKQRGYKDCDISGINTIDDLIRLVASIKGSSMERRGDERFIYRGGI